MGRRLKRIERSRGRSGVFFEPDEFEVFRECIRQSYYYEQTRIDTEDPTAYAKTHITVPTERTAEYQALYSEAFILLEYYTSSFDSLLRIFPISINNLDIYSAFRSYHRQHVLPAKNQENRKPEEWSEKRCKRTNVIVLERGLVERAKSPPEDWILPYLTLPINELDKLLDACKEKTESSKGESLAA